MCGAVVLSWELPRQAGVTGTVGLRDKDRRLAHRLHRRWMIQSALIRIIRKICDLTNGYYRTM
jgi:hypothetical protein